MSGLLESECCSLRRQLDTLLEEAQRNEDKMRRFDELERRLIGAVSIIELIDLLLDEYKQAFNIDHITLCLVDPDHEVRGILDSNPERGAAIEGLTLCESTSNLELLYGSNPLPMLGAFDHSRHAALFGAHEEAIGSVALLPLVRHHQLIGSLHFGSASIQRYAGDYGTDFLERLAAIVAVCLDSALSHERLKQMGLTDALTGVYNRRYFEHRCAIEVSQARRHSRALCCMFIDVDRFKKINDTYGHAAGDEILRSVAANIQVQLRAGDTVARYGGEEFVVLLPQTDAGNAQAIADRIRTSIERKLLYAKSGQGIKVTISAGVSQLALADEASDDLQQASVMLNSADDALYRAKHNGRNRVEYAGPSAQAPRRPDRPAGWKKLVRSILARIA